MRGPSPRARGARGPGRPQPGREGTIPACAGSTKLPVFMVMTTRDHPRVRGEHTVRATISSPSLGPSPRARGALPVRRTIPKRPGTIPACAGSTTPHIGTSTCRRDHPRVRGEHLGGYGRGYVIGGPSPRARGARPAGRAWRAGAGTIPACAGSTSKGIVFWLIHRDHPRVRGEHNQRAVSGASPWGPSPRARGAPRVEGHLGLAAGTIPACAGSTGDRSTVSVRRRDHPRVRGEHTVRATISSPSLGPSPRARGARFCGVGEQVGTGTIPACAGSTRAGCARAGRGWDHPRVRGEHLERFRGVVHVPGPSPRARGARHGR